MTDLTDLRLAAGTALVGLGAAIAGLGSVLSEALALEQARARARASHGPLDLDAGDRWACTLPAGELADDRTAFMDWCGGCQAAAAVAVQLKAPATEGRLHPRSVPAAEDLADWLAQVVTTRRHADLGLPGLAALIDADDGGQEDLHLGGGE